MGGEDTVLRTGTGFEGAAARVPGLEAASEWALGGDGMPRESGFDFLDCSPSVSIRMTAGSGPSLILDASSEPPSESGGEGR